MHKTGQLRALDTFQKGINFKWDFLEQICSHFSICASNSPLAKASTERKAKETHWGAWNLTPGTDWASTVIPQAFPSGAVTQHTLERHFFPAGKSRKSCRVTAAACCHCCLSWEGSPTPSTASPSWILSWSCSAGTSVHRFCLLGEMKPLESELC